MGAPERRAALLQTHSKCLALIRQPDQDLEDLHIDGVAVQLIPATSHCTDPRVVILGANIKMKRSYKTKWSFLIVEFNAIEQGQGDEEGEDPATGTCYG